MRYRAAFAVGLLVAAGLFAGQTPPDIYRIDLILHSHAYSLDKPVLQGNSYVFHSWPENKITHLKKTSVLKITPWHPEANANYRYRVDVLPAGYFLSRDNPVLQGGAYVFRKSEDGLVVSVRQSEVKSIVLLTGAEAFWAEQGVHGAVAIGDVAMEGGNSSQAGPSNLNTAPAHGQAPGNPPQGQQPSNWYYQGQPGVSDAWAPASATVASPGDVPRMPDDGRTPH